MPHLQQIGRTYCKYLLSTFLLFLLLWNCSAQSNIHGIIVDTKGKALPNANVLLLKAKDSTLIRGVVTSVSGAYSFLSHSSEQVMVTVTFTGYKQVYSSIFTPADKKDVDLGTISLSAVDKELKAVVVVAKKPLFEQKIDRMVINVKNSITSAGSTALDILERSPGILVDRQNSSISMGGKDGVVVLINGKINHMPMSALVQMLAGMNSGNIEKIELITTPPANFDAEGNAGFINIVLVKNTLFGTNGSYSVTGGFGKGERSLANFNFNHRKGKINIAGDFSFSRIRSDQVFEFYRLVHNSNRIIESNSTDLRNTLQRNYNGRLGFDYEASKKTTIGMELSAYDNKWSMDAKNSSTIAVNQHTDTVISIINDEINQWSKLGGSLNIQHTVKENEKVTFEYDYDNYSDNNPNNFYNSYFNGSGNFLYNQQTSSRKNTPITIQVLSSDYTKKLTKNIDLEAGVKFSSYRFTNDVSVSRFLQNVWVPDKDLTAKYFLKEDIPAVYSALSFLLSDKNNLKLGLRYEYTNSNLGTTEVKNIVDRHYGKLFPSFFISHKFNDDNSINFSYSKRITRPTFRDLAPFVYFVDPSTFISGNSALQASVSNTVSAAYTYKRNIFSLSYSNENDFIAGFQSRVDTVTNKQYLIAQNYPSLKTLSLVLSVPVSVTDWWSMQNNINGQWQQVNALYNKIPFTLQHANYNVSTTQTFKLPKDFSIELQGFYRSAGLFGTYLGKPLGALNLGVQKKLSGNNGKLAFNVKDIFNTLISRFSADIPEQNLFTRGSLRFSNTTFSLTYSKNFGNNEVKGNRKKSAAADEERKRVE